MKHKRMFFWILASSLIAPFIVLVSLMDLSNWITGANRVTWMYGDGTPVPLNSDETRPWPACRPTDIGLNTLSHDHALWTGYRSSWKNINIRNNEGFARIDPASGIGTVWRFPEDVKHASTTGLAIGPNQEVAIVYWVNDIYKDLALGVLDSKKGWVFTPQIIPNSYGGVILATSWVSGKLTVIYQCFIFDREKIDPSVLLPEDRSVWKATYDAGKINVTRLKVPEPLVGSVNKRVCRAIFRDNAWHLVYEDGRDGQLFFLKGDGSFYMAKHAGPSCDDLWDSAETAAFGITTVAGRVSLRKEDAMDLTIDGNTKPLPSPLHETWFANYSDGWLESGTSGLTRYPLWHTKGANKGIARRFDGNWLLIEKLYSHTGSFFQARWLDEKGKERLSRQIALATSFESGQLSYGVPIARKEGGFWLVSQEGAYAAFGEDLRRLDPLPLFQHLYTQGSWCLDEYQWMRIVEFFWILVALPVCLLIGFLMARVLRKDIYAGLCWGGAAYFVPACWAMWMVLPLLW